ncbi:MAG: hypothetical protein ABIG63_17540 [Chloroflexota bacterium]
MLTVEANKTLRGKRNHDEPWRVLADGEVIHTSTAQTRQEAREEAEQILAEFYTESSVPFVLNWRGTMAVGYRDRFGWGYRFYDSFGMFQNVCHCSCGFANRRECITAAVFHLADVKREEGETSSDLFCSHALVIDSKIEQAIDDFTRRAKQNDEFARRYREAIARGMGTGDAHDYAGRNPARRELWETIAA